MTNLSRRQAGDSLSNLALREGRSYAAQASAARSRSRRYADFAQDLMVAKPGLEQEFTRLFVGPGRPAAHPYESVHREGRLMGECSLEVQRLLVKEGLAPRQLSPPDHIGLELSLLAHLAEQEATAWEREDEARAHNYQERQFSFLRDHLAQWLPRFASLVLMADPAAFYRDVVERLQSFVEDDLSRMSPLAQAEQIKEPAQRTSSTWTQISLSSLCTLCGVCARACPQNALRVVRDDRRVSLVFDSQLCDGCAACRDSCPEDAICLGQTTLRGARSTLLSTEFATCSICTRPHTTMAMLNRTLASLDNNGYLSASTRERILMCPACKARLGNRNQ